MPRGDEERVVLAFCAWLRGEGWDVQVNVNHIDVLATRAGVRLVAEVKGVTSSPGLDIDTGYGQLLRRMPDTAQERTRYALVVPQEILAAALRVPTRIRDLLGIEVFAVDQNGHVSTPLCP